MPCVSVFRLQTALLTFPETTRKPRDEKGSATVFGNALMERISAEALRPPVVLPMRCCSSSAVMSDVPASVNIRVKSDNNAMSFSSKEAKETYTSVYKMPEVGRECVTTGTFSTDVIA
ncbi:hypothetical protein cyc_07689 [Cyclospora cayetanensis]|uniref:Uncharacterized protein n=1 Tax=Cyclospora cayetanensis TaxID=88456 RepID=A0A1D3D5Y4_9EIME|nr:hypothetical protein cyc_07689 [Cyclospora cayetanensis]